MTDGDENAQGRPSLAGKWQVPLFGVSVIVFALAAWFFLGGRPEFDWDEEFAQVEALTEYATDGDYVPATDAASELLEKTAAGAAERRGKLHIQLAEIRWRSMAFVNDFSSEQQAAIRDEYAKAIGQGVELDGEMLERMAGALAAMGQTGKALDSYRAAGKKDPARAHTVGRKIIELNRAKGGLTDEELLVRLSEYLRASGLSRKQYAWALDEAVGLLLKSNQLRKAETFISRRQREAVGDVDRGHHVRYQLARLLAAQGKGQQASDQLSSLIYQVEPSSKLSVVANLLLGQLVWPDNPPEAERAFQNVLSRSPGSPMAAAAELGLAQTYTVQGMCAEALERFEFAFELLDKASDERFATLPDLRKALADSRDEILGADVSDVALRLALVERNVFDKLAEGVTVDERLDVLGRLAGAHLAIAEEDEAKRDALADGSDPASRRRLDDQRRENLRAAGNVLLDRVAYAQKSHDRIHGDSLWKAAEAFDKAGLRDDTVKALSSFVAQRPGDIRLAEARFRLGQAFQAGKKYTDAIEMYRANIDSDPESGRNPSAVAGLIPMALCHLALGPEHYAAAEKVLQSILGDSDIITPESEVYREALYVLGQLSYQQGRWEATRAELGEAIQRDPGEPVPLAETDPHGRRWRYLQATRSMYQMAESYRHSAAEAAKVASSHQDPRRRYELQQKASDQLDQADLLYARVIGRFEDLDGRLDQRDEAYRRNSYFLRGECMFSLGRYTSAIERFGRAVDVFQQHSSALAGLTAISNCYYGLGQFEKADAATRRAGELLKGMDPDEVNQPHLGLSPESWRDYLEAVNRFSTVTPGKESS